MLKRIFTLTSFKIGFFATLVVIVVYFYDPLFFRLVDQKALDMKFKSRGTMQPVNEIAIAAIDEKSFDELGRWPWPRSTQAKLVDILTGYYKVKVIGFDVVFSRADDSDLNTLKTLEGKLERKKIQDKRLTNIIRQEKRRVDHDSRFEKSIKKSGKVVLGYFFFMSSEEMGHKKKEDLDKYIENIIDSNYKLVFYRSREAKEAPFRNAYAVESSIKRLCKVAKGQGYLNYIPDDDGSVRRIPMVIKYQDRLFPSFPLMVIREYLGSKNLILKVAGFGVEEIRLGDALIPTDERGHFLVNYYGPSNTFPHYSFTDIIHKRISPDKLKGKIVLVGSTSVEDLKVTPFDRTFPGVEVHANVISNVLSQQFIVRPDWIKMFGIIIMFLLGIIMSILLPRLKTIYGFGFALFLIPSYFFIDRYLFIHKGLWLTVVYPVVLIVFVYAEVTLFRYMTEEKEKRFIRGAFGQYLSPKVIEQLMDDPEMLKLGGERKVLTAFFSDVAGFSSVSEKLEPEELVELLNDYLTEMSRIILKYEGTVDKYEGDAIIAFFGAPLSMEDHALKACLVSIEMQKRLQTLREKWKEEGMPELFCRIGLNTGPMVVGNMGSKTRMDYTIMGDAVNLASRLEGINKQYHTSILITKETYESTNGGVEARELDVIRVVGKKEPVSIYELLGKKGDIGEKKEKAIKVFNDGLQQYREGKWEEAMDCFQKVLDIDSNDGPSTIYVERCKEFINNQPPDGWDGVFEYQEK
jgi:adenylate cyclase